MVQDADGPYDFRRGCGIVWQLEDQTGLVQYMCHFAAMRSHAQEVLPSHTPTISNGRVVVEVYRRLIGTRLYFQRSDSRKRPKLSLFIGRQWLNLNERTRGQSLSLLLPSLRG